MTESRMTLRICTLLLLFAGITDAKMELISSGSDFEFGKTFFLVCKAGAEGIIKWQKGGEDAEDLGLTIDEIDETTSKLYFANASFADSGLYTCRCEFDSGLTEEKEQQIYIYQRPTFHGTSGYHEFLVGQKAVIPCIVDGKPAVDVTWRMNDNVFSADSTGRITVEKDNSLQINGTQLEDHGSYTCEAKIRGRPIKSSFIISVVINVAPKVIIKQKFMDVSAESNVSIICLVYGMPKPNITWTSPSSSNSSRYVFNSDRSELTIPSVKRSDAGEYICTATNKISESNDSFILNVSVKPTVSLSKMFMAVHTGMPASVTCQGTGHPNPTVQWVKKSNNNKLTSSTGRVKVVGSTLKIDGVEPSDGGLYTCIAINSAGKDSKDFSLKTLPGTPINYTVTPGPSSVKFAMKLPIVDGGSPITEFILEWKKLGDKEWLRQIIPSSELLEITSLEPYTSYLVRFAAVNYIGRSVFSSEHNIHTLAKQGEPDRPLLVTGQGKVENKTFSIPIKQQDAGGSPILYFSVRYRVDPGEEWQDVRLPSNSTGIFLAGLQYNTSYLLEAIAVNSNGQSSPVFYNFTIPEAAVASRSGLGIGGMVGIVILILLVLLVAIDVTCCYTNDCGLLMSLAVKVLGRKSPRAKEVEEGDGDTSIIDMKLKGLNAPRGSIPKQQPHNGAQNGVKSDVTCDKAPLTKFEKLPSSTDPSTEA